MGKRKGTAVPQRVDESKRRQLTWNLEDLYHDVTVVNDNNPLLTEEGQDVEKIVLPIDERAFNILEKEEISNADLAKATCCGRSQDLINECSFYISVHSTGNGIKFGDWRVKLGTLQFLITASNQPKWLRLGPPNVSMFWVYINQSNPEEHLVYYETDDNESGSSTSPASSVAYFVGSCDMPMDCLEALQLKSFYLEFDRYDNVSQLLHIHVYATESAATTLTFSSEGFKPKKVNMALQKLMDFFHGIQIPAHPGPFNRKEDVEHLYEINKERHRLDDVKVKVNPQHPCLKPRLRDYQKEAVVWMVGQEATQSYDGDCSAATTDTIHSLYEEITLYDQVLYYNKWGGYLVRNRPEARASPPGGILADEMGLGKTVEVLSCMLVNPRQNLPKLEALAVIEQEETKDDKTVDPDPRHIEGNVTDAASLPANEGPGSGSVASASHTGHNPGPGAESPASVDTLPLLTEASTLALSHDHDYTTGDRDKDAAPRHGDPEPLAKKVKPKAGCSRTDPGPHWSEDCQVIKDRTDRRLGKKRRPRSSGSKGRTGDLGRHRAANPVDQSSSARDEMAMPRGDEAIADGRNEAKDICDDKGIDDKRNNDDVKGDERTGDKSVGDESHGDSTIGDIKIDDGDKINLDKASGEDINACIVDMKNEDMMKPDKNIESGNAERIVDKEPNGEVSEDERNERTSMGGARGRGKRRKGSKRTRRRRTSVKTNSAEVKRDKNAESSDAGVGDNKVEGDTEWASSDVISGVGPKGKSRNPVGKKKRVFVEYVEEDLAPKPSFFADRTADKRHFFECICGQHMEIVGAEKHLDGSRVQCNQCGLWQHAQCVQYNLSDPYRGEYLCPHCHVASVPIPSGATLIISPNSICHQWMEEIQKHVKQESLNVMVYTGVSKQGFIQPRTLANQNIVITTYETLRKEIDYVDLPHSNCSSGRRLRHPKRFMAIPSPIITVEWWRICLDEAQMVECTTTKTAEMALRLSAVNRWCVTGTPIHRGVSDLYGLLLFLGREPYWVHIWWQKCILDPYYHGNKAPLYDVMEQIMWRTAKKDVLDQICLPTQAEETHWLTFSPVEEHFYRRQFQHCAREAMRKLSKFTDTAAKLSSLDRYTLHQLLYPLVRLRQACCHPQAVRGEFLPIHKSTMTMEELLQQLIKKARLECEESLRQLVFAMNGLAAIHILKDELADAVDKYREVLRSVEVHRDVARTDELQQLHTLHNLRQLLARRPAGVPPTLRDSQLPQQCAEIKAKYLSRFTTQVTQALDSWAPVQRALRELERDFRPSADWWADLLQWTIYRGVDLGLVEKLKEDLTENASPQMQNMASRFRDVRGLEYLLSSQLNELQNSHQTLVDALRRLTAPLSAQTIANAVECCLRPSKDALKTCALCKADELFENYESRLFSFVDKGVTEQPAAEGEGYQVSTRRQGTWADSQTERALKTLIHFTRPWGGERHLLDAGALHLRLLDQLKKEFRCLRAVWLAVREHVSAMDELDMATTRLRLRLPDEPVPETPQANVLDRDQLDAQKLRFQTDKIVAQSELRKKLGQQLYLKNLATAHAPMENGENPALCPVCQRKLGRKWSVLQCGHCYCLACIQILVDQYSFGRFNRSLKCPVCRERTSHGEISYVSTRSRDQTNENQHQVKGDLSTKVEGILRCLLNIQKTDPEAKALVFSTWTDVLDLVGQALTQNGITFRGLHAQNKFQKNMDAFKHDENVRVLLLPVHSGSNGLNLIEATHVLLVEPILNGAQELQAIGRVHRIGQTRPTTVHRFLVRNTIEERMHGMLQSVRAPVNSHNAEETTLTLGEFSALFTELQGQNDEDEDEEEEGEHGEGGEGRPSAAPVLQLPAVVSDSRRNLAAPTPSSRQPQGESAGHHNTDISPSTRQGESAGHHNTDISPASSGGATVSPTSGITSASGTSGISTDTPSSVAETKSASPTLTPSTQTPTVPPRTPGVTADTPASVAETKSTSPTLTPSTPPPIVPPRTPRVTADTPSSVAETKSASPTLTPSTQPPTVPPRTPGVTADTPASVAETKSTSPTLTPSTPPPTVPPRTPGVTPDTPNVSAGTERVSGTTYAGSTGTRDVTERCAATADP